MLSTLAEYARVVEAVAARPATDPATPRALDVAAGHVEQLGLLSRELDTYWPPEPGGGRPADGVPDRLLALAQEFGALAARCGEHEAVIVESCRGTQQQALAGLRNVRVIRRTEGRYHALSQRAGGLVDLER
jgi:hypothetical protein